MTRTDKQTLSLVGAAYALSEIIERNQPISIHDLFSKMSNQVGDNYTWELHLKLLSLLRKTGRIDRTNYTFEVVD